jgi:hypothetical protein
MTSGHVLVVGIAGLGVSVAVVIYSGVRHIGYGIRWGIFCAVVFAVLVVVGV